MRIVRCLDPIEFDIVEAQRTVGILRRLLADRKALTTDLRARNVRRDGEHRDATAVTVVQPVDQMEVPGAATSGADRQPAGEMRVRAGGERGGLFVPHMDPSHPLVSANRVRDSVQRVA